MSAAILWLVVAALAGDGEIAISPVTGSVVTVGTAESRATLSGRFQADNGFRFTFEGSAPFADGVGTLFDGEQTATGTKVSLGLGWDRGIWLLNQELDERVEAAMKEITAHGPGVAFADQLLFADPDEARDKAILDAWEEQKGLPAYALAPRIKEFCGMSAADRLSGLAVSEEARPTLLDRFQEQGKMVSSLRSETGDQDVQDKLRGDTDVQVRTLIDKEVAEMAEKVKKAKEAGVAPNPAYPAYLAYQAAVHEYDKTLCALMSTDLESIAKPTRERKDSDRQQAILGVSQASKAELGTKDRFYLGLDAGLEYNTRDVLPVGETFGDATRVPDYKVQGGLRLEADFGQWTTLRAYARAQVERSIDTKSVERCTTTTSADGAQESTTCEDVEILTEPAPDAKATGEMGLGAMFVFPQGARKEENEDAGYDKVAPGLELRGDLTGIGGTDATLAFSARGFIAGMKDDAFAHIRGGIGLDVDLTFGDEVDAVPSLYLLFGSVFQ